MKTEKNFINIVFPETSINDVLICEIIYQVFIDSVFSTDFEKLHDIEIIYPSALPEQQTL